MYVNFETYQLVKPNDCAVNYIDIYENVLSEEKRKARFCGTMTEPQKSAGNIINIRFHAKEGVIDANQRKSFQFDILFTAFRQNDKGTLCGPRACRRSRRITHFLPLSLFCASNYAQRNASRPTHHDRHITQPTHHDNASRQRIATTRRDNAS